MCPNFDSFSKITSQWKKNWHNFWSRHDLDLWLFLIFVESVSMQKMKLHAFPGLQYHFKEQTSP